LITVDELRAAGALDVPAAWRKSLFVEPDLFSGILEDDDPPPNQEESTQLDAERDVSTDSLMGWA